MSKRSLQIAEVTAKGLFVFEDKEKIPCLSTSLAQNFE
jgi:hypothetical protein